MLRRPTLAKTSIIVNISVLISLDRSLLRPGSFDLVVPVSSDPGDEGGG